MNDATPRGELMIQTLAMPNLINANGDIFGGWIVSQMDLAASVLSRQVSSGRAVTVAIHSMAFLRPVRVGHLVSCYAELLKSGNTSLTVGIEVWTDVLFPGAMSKVAHGTFVYVAIDDQGNPRKINLSQDEPIL
jgi:acyl-CoA thioesterase YciA